MGCKLIDTLNDSFKKSSVDCFKGNTLEYYAKS